jgi:hypothetical protein
MTPPLWSDIWLMSSGGGGSGNVKSDSKLWGLVVKTRAWQVVVDPVPGFDFRRSLNFSTCLLHRLIVNRKSGSLKLRLTEFICRLASEFFPCHSKAKTRRRPKPIGALNSARIGEGAKQKTIQNFFLKNWWGLERAQNMRKMSISRVWVVLDKNRLVR